MLIFIGRRVLHFMSNSETVVFHPQHLIFHAKFFEKTNEIQTVQGRTGPDRVGSVFRIWDRCQAPNKWNAAALELFVVAVIESPSIFRYTIVAVKSEVGVIPRELYYR